MSYQTVDLRTVRYVVKDRHGTCWDDEHEQLRTALLEAETLNREPHIARRHGPFRVDVTLCTTSRDL